MAYYKPCKNCAVDKSTCARRAEVADSISGAHITVVNFVCKDRVALFHQGQRVRFNWTSWEPSEFGEDDGLRLVFHGTVIAEHGLHFIVRVDDGPSSCPNKMPAMRVFKNDSLVIKIRPFEMAALNEPDRTLCPSCSASDGEDDRCLGWEDGQDFYRPNGCISKRAVAS